MKYHHAWSTAFLGVILIFLMSPAQAQFRVFSWESFESGQIPATLRMGHDSDETNLKVFDYSSMTQIPGMVTPQSQDELYRYGLQFNSVPKKRFLSVVDHLTLDRQLLGANGKALYQADFFLPADMSKMANTAVLAVVNQPEKGKNLYQFYRLGIMNTGKVYFSYAKDTPQPIQYLQEDIDSLKLERPGWHRFQIIFEGQSRIHCAVDGKFTKFSPIEEPNLRYLNAGIMVVGALEAESESAVVDNLSIQYTNENVPLPDSPWLGAVTGSLLGGGPAVSRPGMGGPTATANTPRPGTSAAGSGATATAPSSLSWMSNPDEAWEASRAQNKSLLILFYAPRVRTFDAFQKILADNPSSQGMLAKYTLLQVDVNQLRGGTLAQKFNIFKVPTVIVMENGVEVRRFTMRNNSTWADIEAVIK